MAAASSKIRTLRTLKGEFWRWLLIKGKSRLVSSCPPVCPALAVCFPIVSALFLRFRCPMFSVVRPILACLPSLCFSAARPFSFCPPSLSLLSRPASSAQRFPSVSISQDFHTASTAPVCPLASIAPGFPYSELRSCLSTREHCSELSTHSGFHSVSSAPVFHSRALLRVLHPLWVYTLLFHSRALFPGSPPALGLHISTYNLGTSLYSA